jgi:hypothetical protein
LGTLAVCAALMGGRTLVTAVPLAGPLAADALALHGLSARMITAAIDAELGRRGARVMAKPRRRWIGRHVTA